MAIQRHLPGKPRPVARVLQEYRARRAQRPDHCPEALWRLLVPPPEELRRWRIQLDCSCIHEVLIHADHELPLGPFYDPNSRHRLPHGQMACCSDRSDDDCPCHFQEIVDWGRRREQTLPADPIDPPDYLADVDDAVDLWAKIRNDKPVTRAMWEVELACGHFAETSAPSLEWQPGDPPETVSAERAARLTSEWEECYATQPPSKHDSEDHRGHRRRMLALRWPRPVPELDCWPCSYARRIQAYEYVGPLVESSQSAPPAGQLSPLASYHRRGVPLEAYELTRTDHRYQRSAEASRDYLREQMKEFRAEEAADPELRERRTTSVLNAWKMLASTTTHDCEIMRWRVRLYCGHVVTTSRHCTIEDPTQHGASSMRCPECGKDPACIWPVPGG